MQNLLEHLWQIIIHPLFEELVLQFFLQVLWSGLLLPFWSCLAKESSLFHVVSCSWLTPWTFQKDFLIFSPSLLPYTFNLLVQILLSAAIDKSTPSSVWQPFRYFKIAISSLSHIFYWITLEISNLSSCSLVSRWFSTFFQTWFTVLFEF